MPTVGTWSAMGEVTATQAPKAIVTYPIPSNPKSSARILIGQFSSFALTSNVTREKEIIGVRLRWKTALPYSTEHMSSLRGQSSLFVKYNDFLSFVQVQIS
jgi:hypothetical protein